MIYFSRHPLHSNDPSQLSQASFNFERRLATFPNREGDVPHLVERHNRHFGHYRIHRDVHSLELGRERDITVFLPPEYKQDPTRRFPVLYMQDAQNLFDDMTSGSRYGSWGVDRIMSSLLHERKIEPVIVVGVAHGGQHRDSECTPGYDHEYKAGGEIHRFAPFLVKEVKALIDDLYRTRPEREHTSIAGSSLGAIAALCTAKTFPETFANVLAFSATFWWGNESLHDFFRDVKRFDSRIFIDYSALESERLRNGATRFAELLERAGWERGRDLHVRSHQPMELCEQAGHSEASWGIRFGKLLPEIYSIP